MPRTSIATIAPKVSLRETVARAVRAAIISGEMTPGTVYSAPALGARFGISPTPVREAMLDLIKEGLVTAAPNKGFRVTEISDKGLDEITKLRQLIEPPIVREVTPLIPDDDMPHLRTLAANIRDWAEKGNLTEYTEADRLFHVTILEYSGNTRLVELISELRAHTRLFGLTPLLQQGRLTASAAEHLDLVDLLEQRKAAEAEAFMYRHIDQVRGIWAGRQG
ncbi:MAG TPA: GntR family transcriptional regulator [Chloroflexota bacterium]|nr:GntR family transcriptional regulator [Chloroflexota bacterium]